MSRRRSRPRQRCAVLVSFAPRSADPVAPKVTTPKEHFGFNLGDDYCLANYEQYAATSPSSRRNPTGSRS